MAAQGANTICLVADGRSKKVRRVFEDVLEECCTDEQKRLDACIVYGAPHDDDMRLQRRKTFGSLSNLEKLVGVLPVPKVRMTSKERKHFSACGEKSTHASSYTNVMMRDVDRLSRLSVQDKELIVGVQLPTYGERIIEATRKGHPLFWGEVKTVEFFVALFADLNVSHVFDVCAGSATAAMAAGICGIGYEGLAMNPTHAAWCNRLVDKAMFAIISQRTDEESKELRMELATYFGPSIEEARLFLSSERDDEDTDMVALKNDAEEDDDAEQEDE
jgi:hypothetical protein